MREPFLYLRLYFKTQRAAYYDLLDRVGQRRLGGLAAFFSDQCETDRLASGRSNAPHCGVVRQKQETDRHVGAAATSVPRLYENMHHLGLVHEITGHEPTRYLYTSRI